MNRKNTTTVTMQDVARAIGVSQPTVSDVLRGISGQKGISLATQKRVLNAVKKMNYRPNRLARALVAKQTRIIGLILPEYSRDTCDLYIEDLSSEFLGELSRNNYRAVVEYATEKFIQNDGACELFKEGLVDAIAFIGLLRSHQPILDGLNDSGYQYILINSQDLRNGAPCVTESAIEGMEAIIGHLISQECRRLCYITQPRDTTLHYNRQYAFLQVCRKHQQDIDEPLLIKTNDITESQRKIMEQQAFCNNEIANSRFPESVMPGYIGVQEMLKLDQIPEAIVAMNDWVAHGVIVGLKEKGLNVPQDILVVGWDDADWSSYLCPPLTTVRASNHIGHAAANTVLGILSGQEDIQRHIEVPGTLVIRNSSCRNGLNMNGLDNSTER